MRPRLSGPTAKRWAATAVLVALFVVIACAARLVPALAGWDETVTREVTARRVPGWDRLFWVFTLLGNDSLLAALATSVTVLLAAWGRRAWAAAMAGGMLVAYGTMHLAKELVHRARPAQALALIEQPGSHSLPSGHAMIGLVFWGFLAYLALRWIRARRPEGGGEADPGLRVTRLALPVAAAAVVMVIGASRVYLGVHWPSDVLAGWCLGGAFLIVTPVALARLEKWRRAATVLGDRHPWGSAGVRMALAAVLGLFVGLVAVLTGWADPLLLASMPLSFYNPVTG